MQKKEEYLYHIKTPNLTHGKHLKREFPVGSKIEGKIKNITAFALFVSIKDFNLDAMIHYKDISYEESEEELKKFKKDDPITAKVLECDQRKRKDKTGFETIVARPILLFQRQKEERYYNRNCS